MNTLLNIDARNLGLFQASEIVADYRERAQLFPPEHRVFTEIGDQLSKSDVLDIGVGGGRTSMHLRSSCKSYTAIDYSPAMIKACRARFLDIPATTFLKADCRCIPMGDSSVDFALFSHNGIDCLSHQSRLEALEEIHRVLRPDGQFFFSSHSLHVYPFKEPEIQALNADIDEGLLNNRGWSIVHDNVSWFYYIYPKTQLEQLRQMKFEFVAAYDMNGRTYDCNDVNDDYMIHYLSSVRK